MNQKWSLSVRLFHWVSVVLLIATWASVELVNSISTHKALGVSLLFWMMARSVNRIFFNQSLRPHTDVFWQKSIAKLTHLILYGLLIAMPLAGLLSTMYSATDIDMFGMFEIPVLVTPNREKVKLYRNLHEDIFWPLLITFTLIHLMGVLYNQFIQKNNILNRMK